jgi:SPP1 gp7 family putative phage head morphogenesis protein
MANRNGQGNQVEPNLVARVAGMTRQNPDWFGPLKPLAPIAPEAAGRQFDYPSGYNTTAKPRQGESITFPQLRALADNYDLLRLVIETRKDQLAKMRWTIKPRDPGQKPDARCKTIESFFAMPDREHSWDEWLRMLIEDLLVIDAPAVYPRLTVGGQLYALEPIDGATIKRVIDATGRTPLPPATAYQQIIKGVAAVDYTRDEMIYRPRNPRTHKVYGFSPVEQVVMTVNIALRRQLHVMEYYQSGSVPDALAGVPADWQPEQIRQFQDYWDTLMEGDSAARRRLKFVPGDISKNFKETKQPPLKDMYDEWLARVICFCFSIEPTPFVAQVNRAVAETSREQSLAEGLEPLQNWIKGFVDSVLIRYFGFSDLEFSWAEETSIDPLVQAQVNNIYITAGVKTPNEVRAELGMEPLDEVPDPEPGGETEASVKVEKAKKALRLIDRDRPVVRRARKALSGSIKRFLKQQAGQIAAQLSDALGLEKSSHGGQRKVSALVAKALEEIDFAEWADELPGMFRPTLAAIAIDGGIQGLRQIGVTSDDLEDLLRDKAETWAADRAAEMVGMRRVDGELVQNPDAKWRIDEGTRDMLRSTTERALNEGWSSQEMAAEIEASYPFSESRAEMIARTEIAKADIAGTMEGYRASGIVAGKTWLTAQDDMVSDECRECGEAGIIGLDDNFPSGEDAPPNHPNCRCVVLPVFDDEMPVLSSGEGENE